MTSETVKLALPWPMRSLSPNARAHWADKASAAKRSRHVAWALTLAALKGSKPDWKAVAIHWEFHPKTANRPDDDNAISSCKAYRDGISDALGINDAKFTTTHSMGEPVKGGAVLVTVRPA
jgi:hypothetical protein